MSTRLKQAFLAFDQGNLSQAEQLYLFALQEFVRIKDENYKIAMNGLAFTYSSQHQFNRARSLYQTLFRLAQYQKDLQWQAIALHQLGMVERLAENFSAAQKIFQDEYNFRLLHLPNDQAGFSANYYEQGYLHLKLGERSQAKQALISALEMAEQAADLMCLGCAHRGLGEVYLALSDRTTATAEFSLSLEAFEKIGDAIAASEVQTVLRELQDEEQNSPP